MNSHYSEAEWRAIQVAHGLAEAATLTPKQRQIILKQFGTEEIYVEAVEFHMSDGESFEEAVKAIIKAIAD